MLNVEKKDKKVSVHFQVPIEKLEDIKRIVACLGGKEETTEVVGNDWEDAFQEKHSGVVIRGLRFRDELTQVELADKIGVLQSHISEMENGRRPIGKAMAKKLARVFNSDYKIFL